MKKITTIITCAFIVISGLFVMNDNQIFAANLSDTFIQGDFTYQIGDLGDSTHNGKVEIIDYDESSIETDLIIPNTVDFGQKEYDIVSIKSDAFKGAGKVVSVHIPKNLTFYESKGKDFIYEDYDNILLKTSLKKITIDESNPIFQVIDGVLYNMESGKEYMALYPYGSETSHFTVPEFLCTSTYSHAIEGGVMDLLILSQYLESIEMPFESAEGFFTDNGMLYSWIDKHDHSKGSDLLCIPHAMKYPVFKTHLTDLRWCMSNSGYGHLNQALDFTFEDDTYYQTIDGSIYDGNELLLYAGGRTEPIYRIPNGTKKIGRNSFIAFLGNRHLKSLILPSSLESVNRGGLLSKTLKSIKVEGSTSIAWDAEAFQDMSNQSAPVHVYYDNGNSTVKQQMQAVFSHLTDEYFHELGAVPTASITEVKTSLENKKDVKVTWNSDQSHINYEVRRYDVNGTYEVVGSTTDTSFVDKTTAYNTTYKYEVLPYSLPVTSSQDSEDPLSTYHTFGTASAKSEIKTPVQSFQGTYVYKDADGKEVSITKTVEVGQSAVSQAPTIPTVTGYTFDKWTSDLTNIEVVDKDFTATATYKKLDDTQTPNNPSSPEKPDGNDNSNKPSDSETSQPFHKKEEPVMTEDQTNIVVLTLSFVVAGLVLTILVRKKYKNV